VRIPGAGRANLHNLGRSQPAPADAAGGADTGEDEGEADVEDGAGAPAPPPAAAMPLDDPETIDITWTEEFIYIEGVDEGSGVVEMYGDVVAGSTSPREDNTLRSLRLSIDFAEEAAPPVSSRRRKRAACCAR
jgi:hypothetical protein